jgi:GGDEF domain-containing protein
MSGFEGLEKFGLREIEFTSDARRDSLTLSISPELFHENLLREIAASKRSGQELTIVSLVLRVERFSSVALFQEALIEIAYSLRHELRGEDFFARISDTGFWLLLHARGDETPAIIERLKLPHHQELSISSVARERLEYKEWIKKVDQIHFT